MKRKQSRIGAISAVAGACLLPFFLLAAVRAFAPIVDMVGIRDITDPAFAGDSVGELLVTATIRGVFALPALLLLVFALISARYRAQWFFWFVSIASIPLFPLLPVGTGFAIFFLVYSLRHRHEFQRAHANTSK